jgi:putative iron-regulated protein
MLNPNPAKFSLCSRLLLAPTSCLLVILSACAANTPTPANTEIPSTDTSTIETAANTPDAESAELQQQIAADFADQVVVPTYQQLVEKSAEFVAAIDTFTVEPTDANLAAAQEKWLETRQPWESSEAFAFGPAASLGYDGDLDDWPVNETDVEAVLASDDELTPEYIAGLQTTQKGFHAIELVLFGKDNDKTAADFGDRDLAYLKAATTAFDMTANELVKSWVEGVEGNPPYREVLATAGSSDNPAYPTTAAVVEEIVQGMLACLDEVGNEKIGVPLETKMCWNLRVASVIVL